MSELTRESILRFDIQGSVNLAICNVCKERNEIPVSFPCNALSKGKRVVYRTRQAYLRTLQEVHYGRHFQKPLPVVIKPDKYLIKIDTYYKRQSVHILEQNLYCNDIPEIEVFIDWEEPDRLLACIINLGLACKWFADSFIKKGIIEIQSDKDGLDQRYDGEQDVMFHLLFPESGFQAKKNAGLYSEYDKYLLRIKQLRWQQDLQIKLNTSVSGRVL